MAERPIPKDEPAATYDADLTHERYYRGTIVKLYAGSERGLVHSASGRNIPFSFMFVTMLGPRRRFADLRVGQEIGFDVSHTSHGLRVSTIRLPDEESEPPRSDEPTASG